MRPRPRCITAEVETTESYRPFCQPFTRRWRAIHLVHAASWIAIGTISCWGQNFSISTIAGNGGSGYSGDGGPAVNANITYPAGIAVDSSGNLYISDAGNHRIRRVSTNGTITTIAGNGIASYSGDGGPATNAALQITSYGQSSSGIVVDAAGNVYIADSWNNRVRKVSVKGIITTVAGTGSGGYSGDGGPAASAEIGNPAGLALDAADNLYISHSTGFDCVVRKVSPNGTITTVAGMANCGYSGDGGPATSALLSRPEGLAVDSSGNLYIADTDNQRIRKVSLSGIITTVAGSGNYRYDGDGGPSTSFSLNYPYGVTVDSVGNLFIADANNHRIRQVTKGGTITTVAGNGNYGFAGDGGPATTAEITQADGIAIDSMGNIYVADLDNNRIRRLIPPNAGTDHAEGPAILFVHGFCATADDWNTLEGHAIDYLTASGSADASKYPNDARYTLYYDGNTVKQYSNGADVNSIPSSARFFAIDFYAPGAFGSGRIDTSAVAQVPILDKADELAHVIRAITGLTKTKDIILVGHSLGGLVSRAYMQDLASTAYGQDVVKLITLDTPHSGVETATLPFLSYLNVLFPLCNFANSVNRSELAPTSSFMDLLRRTAGALPANTTVASIESYTTPGTIPGDSSADDGVIKKTEQSFTQSITGVPTPSSIYYDVSNPFSSLPASCPIGPLHVLSCLGVQPQTWVLLDAEIQKSIATSAPSINAGGIVNDASNKTGPVAPGTIVAVYGDFLLNKPATTLSSSWPTTLAGVTIEFANGMKAPLNYVSSGQINLQVPWEFAGQPGTSITAFVNGQRSSAQRFALATFSPGLFSTNGHGTGQGAILDASYRLVDSSNPAKAGTTTVQLFCTGLGPVTNQPASGAASLSNPLAETTTRPTIKIGGMSAQVLFSGLAPGLVGEYQVNVLVPPDAPSGIAVPVVLSIGGMASNNVTMVVASH